MTKVDIPAYEAKRDPRDATTAPPKPGKTTQSNADVSDVVKNVKRRDR